MTALLSSSPSPLAHAGFQNLLVQRRERELLATRAGLREHQFDVLQGLANSTFGRELAAHHLGALGVHHLRVGRGFACHREKAVRIEPQALGKNEALGKREAIEPENEIDREL